MDYETKRVQRLKTAKVDRVKILATLNRYQDTVSKGNVYNLRIVHDLKKQLAEVEDTIKRYQ